MLTRIIQFSIRNKFLILLLTCFIAAFGIYSIGELKIGAVPDITNNQVQVITTSQNLSTQDVEQFITYPIELEMANLPGVQEIRSISKYGISVVTIVFEDDMGTYLPRQLIAEKIDAAAEKIPQGFGKPEMGPISTGLGEIYQYTLDVKPAYEGRYSARDLRSIQDWIVKRQLSGIKGVVEINTWGGYLKQYEVAFKPSRLSALNISPIEIFNALEKNNGIAGGSYIEKGKETYYIRGEGLVSSIEDIENILVEKRGTLPVYVKDVATVKLGHANRFGAITANGEGEKVMGQIMMLKGANSNEVIEAVKQRVGEISKSLPEGVYINAFLERSALIEKTTNTVKENLILGCLIVIFAVLLLLGNWRSALLIASVIPLCLLFAFGLMNLFEIDANLMSLGAIDFGIIIDGAVIVVEFIAFQFVKQSNDLNGKSPQELKLVKDQLVIKASSKMMGAAIFGQLIILLVFIPILSLEGVEGKMFRPMAFTFCFALIGAMILCLTYLPVMASYLIQSRHQVLGISRKLNKYLQSLYKPILKWSLNHQNAVLGIALTLLISAFFTFSRMGAEFVPTLDEGDFVIQPILKTGTSLSETIEVCTEMENLLLDKFPEVKQVVSRIGAAEVPTDPMSMEQSDVIITLKDKADWVSADSKDELALLMKEEVEKLGVGVEFTQPIEMRFNELITGVRSDIAIKLFGEELQTLNEKALEIERLIQDVEGAADISVEKTVGLPQMKVAYKRHKIARYGVNIADVNQLVNMAFAGAKAGVVFEGEKRYDLVVRMEQANRESIQDLKRLYVDLPNGKKVPLEELAEISYESGAAQISRDDTRRRVVVGIMVRDRDLQSVVNDIRSILDEQLELPVGYNLQYGGQFEQLTSAKQRLYVAVPLALGLIFIMLFFAFQSWKDALLIFTAIPLASVGGILLLALRGMPFSISAGIGFIALFGIAVLNGIVLIEHFKALRAEGLSNREIVEKGALERLRAILLTATAAALGFLPMALSTSAGAEVQRPLATVVIGGLITASLLSLVVLPILYQRFILNPTKKNNSNGLKSLVSVLIIGFTASPLTAQESVSFEAIKEMAFQNNGIYRAAELEAQRQESLIGTAFDLEKTKLFYGYDENNLALANDEPIYVLGVEQSFAFPTVYSKRRKVLKAKSTLAEHRFQLKKAKLEKALSLSYQAYLWANERQQAYHSLDSLFKRFASAAKTAYEAGELSYLNSLTAQAKSQEYHLLWQEAKSDVKQQSIAIQSLIKSKVPINPEITPLHKLSIPLNPLENNPIKQLNDQRIEISEAEFKLQKQAWLPDLSVNYFQGKNDGIDEMLVGYQIGVSVPLFYRAQTSRIRAAKLSQQMVEAEVQQSNLYLESSYLKLLAELDFHEQGINYYHKQGKYLAEELKRAAMLSYEAGEIDLFQLLISLESSAKIKIDYLNKLNDYNQQVIEIKHLTLD